MAIDLVRGGELETAQGIINAADITVPTGDMVEGVYDPAGQYYQLPEFVVADPTNLLEDEPVNLQKGVEDSESADVDTTHLESVETTKEEKGKGKAPKKGDGVKVKARLSDQAKDVAVWIDKGEKVQGLIERIKDEAEVAKTGPPYCTSWLKAR